MVGRLSAQMALLAFATAILAGISVGNTPTTILGRALGVMMMALFLSQLVAWTGRLVLHDHLLHKKTRVDAEHAARREAPADTDPKTGGDKTPSKGTSSPAPQAAG